MAKAISTVSFGVIMMQDSSSFSSHSFRLSIVSLITGVRLGIRIALIVVVSLIAGLRLGIRIALIVVALIAGLRLGIRIALIDVVSLIAGVN